ncbi:lactonase family protein [Limnoglobus roseus]|uniref:Lactonase family protein n=1 Tax=Limnoglobus roseus TaxID=2598579 RepID=A0A5C1AN02_9BACT|nr:lactonase family protein [Limnoglobus roseus]QEL19102.1 lactonase family protein [Limnoglobus roseus]
MTIDRRVFLLGTTALAASTAFAPAADAGPIWAFFGTYTGKESKGIYASTFDPKTGTLGEPVLAAEVGSPSFLAVHPTNKYLYAVGEGAVKGNKGGGVYAFAIDAATGKLTKLNEGDSVGAGPCQVSIDPSGKMLFIANYGGGSSTVFAVNADGKLGKQLAFNQYAGTSVDKGRQEAPHTHCTVFDKAGQHCFVVDLGLDTVMVYAVDPTAGTLSDKPQLITMPKGTGPRHIALNKDNTIAYVNGELNMTANVVKLDIAAGKFEVVQSLSTVPEGKPMKGYSTAETKLHPNGKFVYVSNRGQNSVAAFAVEADGKLKAIGHITGDIKTPRNFNIDPSGKWMLIANQDGNSVQVYALDESGLAKPTASKVKVGSPVCVKFVPAG